MVVFYNFLDRPQFVRAKAEIARKRNRIQPELCALIVTVYVHMRGFVGLMAEKIERIRPNAENCRHLEIITTSNQHNKHSFVRTVLINAATLRFIREAR